MLAFSGCYYGGGEKERFELGEIRKRWATLPVRLLSFITSGLKSICIHLKSSMMKVCCSNDLLKVKLLDKICNTCMF
jgi:hypothetical protein